MTRTENTPTEHVDEPDQGAQQAAEDVVARILARAGTSVTSTEGTALESGDGQLPDEGDGYDGDQLDRDERAALRRGGGVSTEPEDGSGGGDRPPRPERVVLVGLWSTGTTEMAENSLRELAALAETAGSEVLDGLLQRRATPDPSTYLGSGKAAELAEMVRVTGADTVIVDGELSPSQRRS